MVTITEHGVEMLDRVQHWTRTALEVLDAGQRRELSLDPPCELQ